MYKAIMLGSAQVNMKIAQEEGRGKRGGSLV